MTGKYCRIENSIPYSKLYLLKQIRLVFEKISWHCATISLFFRP
jgi:hypothetical protein